MSVRPELVIQDFAGAHNGDATKMTARLLKGGSWKRQRIVCVIPASDLIPAKVCLSLWNLMFPPNNGVVRMLALGMEVGEAYSAAVEGILAHPELSTWEFMLTVEHDNAPPPDGIIKLLEVLEAHSALAAVSGLYFTKGESGVAQIWGDPADPVVNFRPQLPRPESLVECCGLGMGFTLFRLSMFQDTRLRRPWFKTQKGDGGVATQDLYFWQDARRWGYRCAVDCRVKVGHYDQSTDTMW